MPKLEFSTEDGEALRYWRFHHPHLHVHRKQESPRVEHKDPRGKVTDRDSQAESIGQLLQCHFPQPRPTTVTPTRIGGHQQFTGLRVNLIPHLIPPAGNRLGGKLRRVLIDANTHPARVVVQVVDSLGDGMAQLRILKIMYAHPGRLALGMPFPTARFEIPTQFALFRVDREHRLPAFLDSLHLLVDRLKLSIALRMLSPFFGLGVGL
jgi:hypothetical protein